MAQSQGSDPFAEFDAAPVQPAGLPTMKPLSMEQRLIIQNFFDTQLPRKKQYMKQLGFELNPKDENEYKPIGAEGSYAQIDPGVSAYFRTGGLKELAADTIGDNMTDFLAKAPMVSAGASAGAAMGSAVPGAGTAAGAGAGFAVALTGSVLGGAAGNATSEVLKKEVGDMLLSEEIPLDMHATAVQSLMMGVAPHIMKGMADKGKEWTAKVAREFIQSRKEAIVNAASSSGGGLTPKMIQRAADDPEMFSRENVAGANKHLTAMYKEIFGLDTPTKLEAPDQLKGGIFRTAIDPLKERAEIETNKLAVDPNADFTVGELAAPIRKIIFDPETGQGLSQKFSRTADEEAALNYFKSKLSFLDGVAKDRFEKQKKFTPVDQESTLVPGKMNNVDVENIANQGERIQFSAPTFSVEKKIVPQSLERQQKATGLMLDQTKIDFKEGRQFLKTLQDDGMNREIPGYGTIGPYARNLRLLADQKAATAGSPLPEINLKQHEILNTYNAIQDAITPTTIQSAFIGDDTVKKDMIRAAAGEMDRVLGTQYSVAIENGQMKRVVENMYNNPKAFGSGRVLPEAIKAGASGALAGGGAGGATGLGIGTAMGSPGLGAAVGGTVGAVTGGAVNASRAAALASPEAALGAIRNASSKVTSRDDYLAQLAAQSGSVKPSVGAAAAATQLAPAITPESVDPVPAAAAADPFAEFEP